MSNTTNQTFYAPIEPIHLASDVYDKLQFHIYYFKETTSYRPSGIYLSLHPCKISNAYGCDMVSVCCGWGGKKEEGLTCLLKNLTRKNSRLQKTYALALENQKDEIAEAFNRFDKSEITSLIRSICNN